jgi:hypothetical protein
VCNTSRFRESFSTQVTLLAHRPDYVAESD